MRFHTPAIRNFLILVVLMAAAVLTVTAAAAHREKTNLAQLAVEQSRLRTDAELARFFGPVESNLRVGHAWGRRGWLDLADAEALNERWIPVLEAMPQVTSMLIGNSRGEEYLLLKDEQTWRNRLTRAEEEPGQVRWLRWSSDGGLLEERQEVLDYDGRQRPWFTGAVGGDGATVHWTAPYTFFTTKDPGITASLPWRDAEGTDWVIALDVMLMAISVFTSGIQVGERGKVFVLDASGAVMGLPRDPRLESREATREFVLRDPAALGLPEVDAALEQWARNGQRDALFEVSPDWWARMQTVSLGDRTFYIGALVREADFAERTLRVRNQLLAISLLGVLLAVLVGIVVDQAFQRRLREEVARARKIGQYTLEKHIGAGGMGEVYRARHAMLRRPTAVKLMVGRSSPEAVARFEREVQRTAELTHPNTIAIYDYGRTPEDVFYYAMEYVEGLDLDGLMAAGGPLSPARVVHLLVQVCGSLAEAHAAGLVHRDIKPANVMLCRRGGRFDVVKVLDFGLVAELAEDGDVSLMRGTPVGTPRYIAPECLQPGRRIDGRADLYAVGAIGVYLLTGRHAVSGETVAQIWAAHLNDEPLRPSSVRATPADLERVLLWCLRKNPAERPASAEELASALTQCAVAGGWTERDAEAWWGERGEMPGPAVEVQDTEQTFSISVFLDDREEQTSGAGESPVQG